MILFEEFIDHFLYLQKIHLMVGKSLGGTSILDSGMYLPANLEDFHRWSYTYQLSGWSYSDMKKYLFELSQSERDSVGFRVHPLDLLSLNDSALLNMLDEGFHERVMDPLKFVWLRSANQLKQPIRYGEEQELFTDGGFFVPKSKSDNDRCDEVKLIKQIYSFIAKWIENKSSVAISPRCR